MNSSKGLSNFAVLLIVVCFFLPWASVSCSGSRVITLTGYDLAAGKEIGGFGQRTDADAALFIIPAAAVVAAWSVFANRPASQRNLIQVLGGLAGLVVLGLKWLTIGESGDQMVTVSTEYGLWGTVIGLVLLFVAGAAAPGEPVQVDERPPLARRPVSAPALTQARASPGPEPAPILAPEPESEPRPVAQAPQAADAEAKQCPACGRSIGRRDRFCLYCGHKLRE